MGKLKRKFGNIDLTPLTEGKMTAEEFEALYDPYDLKLRVLKKSKRKDKKNEETAK